METTGKPEDSSIGTQVIDESNSNEIENKTIIRMKPCIGIFEGVAIILGVILGSGIFASPGGVIAEVKSIGLTLVVWILCGIISLFGAICYAELGTSIPKSGGDYAYVQATFGELPAFLFLWGAAMVFVPSSNAIMGLTFSQYAIKPFLKDCNKMPTVAVQLLAAASIMLFTFLNCWNVIVTTFIQKILTVGKLLAIAMILFSGIIVLFATKGKNFDDIWDKSSECTMSHLSIAIYIGFFCYSGWTSLNFMTEELIDPYKNLPRTIYISLPTVTIIYLLINMAYLAVLTPDELARSQTAAEDYANRTFLSSYGWIISALVSIGSLGSLCIHIMTTSRLCFVGARCGHFPILFSYINMYTLTPAPCLSVMAFLSVVFIFTGNVYDLITSTVFVETIFNTLSVISLLYLRFAQPDLPRPVKAPIIIPIFFASVGILLISYTVYATIYEILNAIIIMSIGIPVYFICIYWRNKPAWLIKLMNFVTKFFQKLFLALQEDDKSKV